ncbi:hypothetical protein TRAPUB_4846 [Trametes pubescens]|uniref:Uncharacterized protein n=1 Tax=Trametes pubescens TaxID=154538 RepID=A0A1M2VAJ2_TRAPU|nr:hypothetical protein TRAPUB_4846 [Trametes pubescens]
MSTFEPATVRTLCANTVPAKDRNTFIRKWNKNRRLVTPEITPDCTYLKPLNVVHPFFYPELSRCPQCDFDKVQWNGWTPTGHREVHGVSYEETAIGVQLRCGECQERHENAVKEGSYLKEAGKEPKYCWATTNTLYWERKEHWELPTVTISLDATFRTASKATIVDDNQARKRLFTGGLHTVINENNLILAFRFCQTQLNAEIEEMLGGLKRRYMICVLGGMKNPVRSEVARSIVDAILKSRANEHAPARYWSKEEQETRLVSAYEKWATQGGVWNAAADKTHADQLEHVQKGCLARLRDDIRSDGSRIEGSHKGWNGLQRSHASGIESLTALCYDFVLRRNLRIELSGAGTNPTPFVLSTYGSHHVHLVNACARMWNKLIVPKSNKPPPAGLRPLPELIPADSGETFGLVKAGAAVIDYQNLVPIKTEPLDDLIDLSSQDPAHTTDLCNELGIDPALMLIPQQHGDSRAVTDSAPLGHRSHSIAMGTPLPSLMSRASEDGHDSNSAITLAGPVSGSSGRNITATLARTLVLHADPVPATSSNASLILSATTNTQTSLLADAPAVGFSMVTNTIEESTVPSVGDVINIDAADATGDRVRADPSSGKGKGKKRRAIEADLSDAPVAPRPLSETDGSPAKKIRTSSMSSTSAVLSPLPSSSKLSIASSSYSSDRKPRASLALHPFFLPPPSSDSPATCLLPSLSIVGLTRSQRVMSVLGGIDTRSLAFARNESDVFFLFMRLRAEHKWASYNMSPSKWVAAASIYNTEVDRLNVQKSKTMVRKTPRALMEKLGEVETRILARLASNDYQSKQSGNEKFWREHCHAVALTKTDTTSSGGPRRKVHTCSRCKRIMWAGPEGAQSNHKKGFCSDGVKQKPPKFEKTLAGGQKINALERLPPWPQPAGIFTSGTSFNARRFLEAVQELHDKVVVQNDLGGERAMEHLALSAMLQDRLLVVPATDASPFAALFELFETLQLHDCPPECLVEHDGARYLRINYLDDNGGAAAHSVSHL